MGEWEIYRGEKRARLPDADDGALFTEQQLQTADLLIALAVEEARNVRCRCRIVAEASILVGATGKSGHTFEQSPPRRDARRSLRRGSRGRDGLRFSFLGTKQQFIL